MRGRLFNDLCSRFFKIPISINMKKLLLIVVSTGLLGCSLDANLFDGSLNSLNPSPPKGNVEKNSGATFCISGDYDAPVDVGDGLHLLTGAFTKIGPCGYGLYGSSLTEPVGTMNVTGGDVSKAIADGQGGYFIAGDFTFVDGLPRAGLARVKADGTVDENFEPFGNLAAGVNVESSLSLALTSSKLFVGGKFTSVSNPHGAIVDKATGLTKWSTDEDRFDSNGVITATGDGNGGLYVAIYGNYKGQYRGSVIHLDASGNLDEDFRSDFWGTVKVLAYDQAENVLYVGGANLSSDVTTQSSILSVRGDTGATIASWNPVLTPVNAPLTDIEITPTRVYVTRVNQFSAAPALFAIDKGTGNVAWQKSTNSGSGFFSVTYDGSKIYGSGSFTSVEGVGRQYLAVFDEAGTLQAAPAASPASWVESVLYDDGYLYIGGWFQFVGGIAYHGLARYRTSDMTLDAWNPNPTYNEDTFNTVNKMISDQNGTLYVMGSFSRIGSDFRAGVAAISMAGAGTVQSWNPDPAGGTVELTSLTFAGTDVFVGGKFKSVGAPVVRGLAVLNPATGDVEQFDSQILGGEVKTLTVSQDQQTLYVGGGFRFVRGQVRNGLAALNVSDNSLKPWAPITSAGTFDKVYFLQEYNNVVYLQGFFSEPLGLNMMNREDFAAIDQNGNVLGWVPDISNLSDVSDFLIEDGILYIVGRLNEPLNKSFAAYDIKGHGALMELGQGYEGNYPSAVAIHNGVVYVSDGPDLISLGSVGGGGSGGGNQTASLGGDATLVYRYSSNIGDLAVSSGKLLVAASDLQGPDHKGLALVNFDEGEVSDWIPPFVFEDVFEDFSDAKKVGDYLYMSGMGYNDSFDFIAKMVTVNLSTGTYQVFEVDGEVYEFEVFGDVLFVAGEFQGIGGSARANLASFREGAMTAWQPVLDAIPYFMEISQGVVFIGGEFTSVDGIPRNGLAAFDASTGALRDWNPLVAYDFGFSESAVVTSRGIYITIWTELNGEEGEGILAVTGDLQTTPWTPPADFDIWSPWLERNGQIVYVSAVTSKLVVLDLATNQPVSIPWELPAAGLTVARDGSGVVWEGPSDVVYMDDITGKVKAKFQHIRPPGVIE